MPKLPVFSTIGQGMAVFGLFIGRIFLWAGLATLLGGLAVGGTVGLAYWKDAIGHGWNPWLAPVGVAIMFAIQAYLPLVIRINQLAVLGRVERIGYMEMVFSTQSFRYLGYACIVGVIMTVGFLLAFTPAAMGVFFAKSQATGVPGVLGWLAAMNPAALGMKNILPVLGALASLSLVFVFIVLTAPLNLVFPAVAVERDPSLGRSYNLGSRNKLRLFWCMVLSSLLFAFLTMVVDVVAQLFGAGHNQAILLLLVPARVLLLLFNWVTSISIPAVAYRYLAGLPDPQAAGGGKDSGREETGPGGPSFESSSCPWPPRGAE